MAFTDAELMAASPVLWAQLLGMQIIHPTQGSIPWRFYPYQLAYLTDTSQFRAVVKARQVGMSQTVALEALHTAVFNPNSTLLFISRKEDLAVNLLKYVRDLIYSVPLDAVGGELETDNLLEIQLANGSRIKSESAGRGAGRGFAGTGLYMDEAAWMEWAADIYQSALPATSLGGRMTILSTPNGRSGTGGFFWQIFSSEMGTAYAKHRIPWYRCPAYNPRGFSHVNAAISLELGMQHPWYLRTRPAYTVEQWASEYECIAAGVPVFVRGKGFVPVEQVRTGDSVMGSRGQWVNVLGTRAKYATSIFNIDIPLGSSVRATGNHPFLVDGEFREVSTLARGMFAHRPQPRPQRPEQRPFDLADFAGERSVALDGDRVRVRHANAKWHTRFIPWNADLGTLLGYYATEGCQSRHSVMFSFAAKEHDLAARCVEVVRSLFGIEAKVRTVGPVRSVVVNSVLVANFLKGMVPGLAYNKSIRPDLLDGDSEFTTALLRAMLDGDGCQTHNCVVYTSTSSSLASAAWYLFARAGFAANFRQLREAKQAAIILGRTVNQHAAWDVRVYTTTPYQAMIVGTDPVRSSSTAGALPTADGWSLKIRGVQEVPYDNLVYDLDTDDDDTFCAAGIACMNCNFVLSGQSVFLDSDVDRMADLWQGPTEPVLGREYLKAWDIGRARDATVGIVADITDFDATANTPLQIVHFKRYVGLSYENVIESINEVHQAYPGWTYVESNGPGDAVLDMLGSKYDSTKIVGYHTTKTKKRQAIEALQLLLERNLLACGYRQLMEEMRIYTWDDQAIIQDSVMAAAILARQLVTPGVKGGWLIGSRTSETPT